MGPASTTALGVLTGLFLFLAMAITGVLAVNGANQPGLTPAEESAGAGSTAPLQAIDVKSPTLDALDLNGDRRLSLAEAAGYPGIVSRFDRADRNRDGQLSQAEFDRLARLPDLKPPKPKKPRRSRASAPVGG